MINETQIQLLKMNSKMNISFILLPNQQNVYDEFVKYLNSIQTLPSTIIPKLSSIKKTTDQTKIPYDEKSTKNIFFILKKKQKKSNFSLFLIVIKITLISSNNNHLIKCKNDILELSYSLSYRTQLTNKHDMIDWSQNTINQYYNYCLKQYVIPKLDFDTLTLELIGPKDAVI